jgi:hypothetical protein
MTPIPLKGTTMNKLTAVKVSVKNFWHNNKGTIAATSTILLVAGGALYRRHVAVTNEFLKDHDLYEEFYAPEDIDA